jgi:hypothetical protein
LPVEETEVPGKAEEKDGFFKDWSCNLKSVARKYVQHKLKLMAAMRLTKVPNYNTIIFNKEPVHLLTENYFI